MLAKKKIHIVTRHNVIDVKAWCALYNPLGRLYQVRQTELMGFGGVAFLPKVNFQSQKRGARLRLVSMLFLLLFFTIDKDRSP